MSDEEKEEIEYIKNCLDNEYNFKNATRQKDKKAYNIILNLIEKQQKEIEELKEDKYGLEEEVQIQAKQLIEIDGNYISKEESKQKEKQAYIDGTNAADELCNKKWEKKIKAKIEEYKKQIEELKDSQIFTQTEYEGAIKFGQSLLEKE